MAGILCIVGFLLAGRLGWIQIARGSQYEEMAMNQTEGVQTLYSPRGTIYDTNGKELAFSIMVKSLYADPVQSESAACTSTPSFFEKNRLRF